MASTTKRTNNGEVLGVYLEPIKLRQYDTDSTTVKIGILLIEEGDRVRNPGSDHWADDLHFSVCCSWKYDGEFKMYAFDTEYSGYKTIDLRTAERLYKTMKRVAAAREKFPITPATFGQYVAMMAKALGITRTIQLEGRDTQWHDKNSYQISDTKYLQGAIDRLVDEFRERVFPKVEVA